MTDARDMAPPATMPPPSDSEWIDIPLSVDSVHDGYRLDRFLARRIKRLSRTRIQEIIAGGQVSRASVPMLRSAVRVRLGDELIVRRPALVEPSVPRTLAVLYRDDDLLVLDKAPGVPVHPSARYHRNTLTSVMREHWGRDHGWEMAHRLDRETSGVMVFGRRGVTTGALKRAFQERRICKEYLALVHGNVGAAVDIDMPLGPAKGSRVRIKMGPRSLVDGGLVAFTRIEPLCHGEFRGRPITLIRALPRTGRQHQIRVHLSEIGHGIVGDKLYGIEEQAFIEVADHGRLMSELEADLGLNRQALHAFSLELPHPRDDTPMRFVSPWPEDLARVLAVDSA